jgi:hypothetical protein
MRGFVAAMRARHPDAFEKGRRNLRHEALESGDQHGAAAAASQIVRRHGNLVSANPDWHRPISHCVIRHAA